MRTEMKKLDFAELSQSIDFLKLSDAELKAIRSVKKLRIKSDPAISQVLLKESTPPFSSVKSETKLNVLRMQIYLLNRCKFVTKILYPSCELCDI